MTMEPINGVELAEQHPDTFEVPSEDEKRAIKVGNHIKIGFRFPSPVETEVAGNTFKTGAERFWVLVTGIDYPKFVGTVDNDLVAIKDLKFGDEITLDQTQILSIC